MNKYYGYMLLTPAEIRSEHNRQELALLNYSKRKKFEYTKIYSDAYNEEDELNKVGWKTLETVLGPGDVIVVRNVATLSRNPRIIFDKYKEFMHKGVRLEFTSYIVFCTDYLDSLIRNIGNNKDISGSGADDFIIELLRTEIEAIDQRRSITKNNIRNGMISSDKKLGRKSKLTDELKYDLQLYINKELTQKVIIEKHGLSKNTVRKYAELMRDIGNYNM